MSNKSKKRGITKVGIKPLVAVDPTLPSFEGHPFFEKKAQAVKRLLKKVGLPSHLNPRLR